MLLREKMGKKLSNRDLCLKLVLMHQRVNRQAFTAPKKNDVEQNAFTNFYLYQKRIHLNWRWRRSSSGTAASTQNIINYNLWISLWASVRLVAGLILHIFYVCDWVRVCLCLCLLQQLTGWIDIIRILWHTKCHILCWCGVMKMDGWNDWNSVGEEPHFAWGSSSSSLPLILSCSHNFYLFLFPSTVIRSQWVRTWMCRPIYCAIFDFAFSRWSCVCVCAFWSHFMLCVLPQFSQPLYAYPHPLHTALKVKAFD